MDHYAEVIADLTLRAAFKRQEADQLDATIAHLRSITHKDALRAEPITTAPKPLPEGEANSSPHLETPAEEKAVDQEPPEAGGSGGVQDRCESTPPPIQPETVSDEIDRIQKETGPDSAKTASEEITPASGEAEVAAQSTGLPDKPAGEQSSAAPARVTFADRVAKVHAEHPDWPAPKIAQKLNRSPRQVRTAADHAGISLPSAKRGPKPDPAPKPAEPAKPSPAPVSVPTRPMREVQTHAPVKPKGKLFYLREARNGDPQQQRRFLHGSCVSLTNDRTYAWQGTESQLLACRKKYLLAQDLTEEVVD